MPARHLKPDADLQICTDRSIEMAPLPTKTTLRFRKSLPAQTMRFAALNARIMRMVFKGHH